MERIDQRPACVARLDDVVDIAALGGIVRIGKLLAVVVDQLGGALLGVVGLRDLTLLLFAIDTGSMVQTTSSPFSLLPSVSQRPTLGCWQTTALESGPSPGDAALRCGKAPGTSTSALALCSGFRSRAVISG